MIMNFITTNLFTFIKFIKDNTLENIYRYIIYFTEHYHGYQGFYEFYKGKQIGCYKKYFLKYYLVLLMIIILVFHNLLLLNF